MLGFLLFIRSSKIHYDLCPIHVSFALSMLFYALFFNYRPKTLLVFIVFMCLYVSFVVKSLTFASNSII